MDNLNPKQRAKPAKHIKSIKLSGGNPIANVTIGSSIESAPEKAESWSTW